MKGHKDSCLVAIMMEFISLDVPRGGSKKGNLPSCSATRCLVNMGPFIVHHTHMRATAEHSNTLSTLSTL